MTTARARWIRALLGVAVLVAVAAPGALARPGYGHGKDKGSVGEESPLVIGHRGASGYLPEHTLRSYRLAIKLGADYVEPDLVATKDAHLIARHEPNITTTTDVADHPEFADRFREDVLVDGNPEDGWFASDFTLKEIRTLRAVQTFPERSHKFDGKFKIPTFEEVIKLVQHQSKARHRTIGIYPETKHPTYHKDLGLPLEGRLVAALDKAGWDSADDPVFIQSFEQSNLQQLNQMTDVRLVQLVDAFDVLPDGTLDYQPPFDRPYDWTVSNDPVLEARTFAFFATDEGLAEISTYADGIGPWKRYIVSTEAVDLNGDGTVGDENGDGAINEADRRLLPPTDLIDRAHDHGLVIHTWTFRNEPSRLPVDYEGDPINEYLQFYELGIDGVFSDFPDTAVEAREVFAGG
jgi:glycerophosphoryl diester phosphodiesterase